MANVVDRLTGECRRSVHTPNFPIATHIHNPANFDDVVSWPQPYRVINGDVISLADAATRAAIDTVLQAAKVAAEKVAEQNEFDDKRVLKALAELLVTEFNLHAEKTNAVLAAAASANNLGDFKTAMSAITDLPVRTFAQLRTAIRDNIDAGAN